MTALLVALRRRLQPYRAQTGALVGALLVQLAFENGLPLSLKYLIDDGIVPRDSGRVRLILGIVLIGAVVYALAGILSDRLYAALGANVLRDIRRDMFGHLQRLPVTSFTRLRGGDITSRFSGDLQAVENALIVSLPTGALSAIGLVVSLTILFALQWQLTLVAAVGLPIAGVFPRLLAARATEAEYEMRTSQGRIGDAVHESVAGQVVVKAFGLRASMVAAFEPRLQELRRISVRANFLAYLMERTPNLSIVAVHLVVLWTGALLAIHGSLSVGALVSFNGIFLMVSQSVYGITFALPDLVRASAAQRRIQELLDEPIEEDEVSDSIESLTGAIELRNVSFAPAPGEPPLLEDVSITIAPGAFVALVGGSGSGKSTLINLLLRFHDPTAGTIVAGGHDLRSVTRESLRARIGVVLQDTFLFDTTIGENVALSRPGASTDDIIAACTDAGIHDHLSGLRDGYESRAGERGGRMSGGQRQRIAIARAILRRPDLLILDEATSALDPATEAEVNATLRLVARGRTTVSATHRLASITDADLIVVLDGGRVAEQGTHDVLLSAGGPYRALWDKQSSIVVETTPQYTIDPAALCDVELLRSLDDNQRGEVAALLTSEQHPPGGVVFSQGDRGDALYIVARGRIEILQDGRPIRVLEEGDHFGEIALVSARERTAGARAVTATILLRLGRRPFAELLDRHSGLRTAVEASARSRLELDARRSSPASGLVS